ncbi:MAG: hypothetical protein M1825_000353 [Sarcosagium campestre]|nr:MAG: hypothetical protein M1825_000353 [Sarcosagium campestre]
MVRKRKRSDGVVLSESSQPARQKVKSQQSKGDPDELSTTHRMLLRFYPQVQTLREYILCRLTPDQTNSRRKKINRAAKAGGILGELLNATLIGHGEQARDIAASRQGYFEKYSQQIRNSTASSHEGDGNGSQTDIVEFAVLHLFNDVYSGVRNPPHLLCRGYQRSAVPRQVMQNHLLVDRMPGLVCQSPNTLVTELKGPFWAEVLLIMGKDHDRMMLELLVDCGIFVSIKNGEDNFCQLSGVPLDEQEEIPNLDQVVGDQEESRSKNPTKPLDQVILMRRRMLYAKAAENRKGDVQFGLARSYILNRYPDRLTLEETLKVIRHIFPRHFGEGSILDLTVNQGAKGSTLKRKQSHIGGATYSGSDGTECDHETSTPLSEQEIPEGLSREIIDIFGILRRQHNRTSYWHLLQYYCPIQASSKEEERTLLDQSTPSQHVAAFCKAVIGKVFPNRLWGTERGNHRNKRIVMQHVDRFIRMSRYENISIDEVLQHLELDSMDWLNSSDHCRGRQCSPEEAKAQCLTAAELIHFLFDSFLIALVRSHFYVTESSVSQNRLYFFRHDVWLRLSRPALLALRQSIYEELPVNEAQEVMGRTSLPYNQIRLLPKANGFRSITNFSRRLTKKPHDRNHLVRSVNTWLQPVARVLNLIKVQQPELTGSGISSVGEMYPRLGKFKSALKARRVKGPFYFVKLDVKNCFDSMPQGKILSLLKKLIGDEYRMERHTEMAPGEQARPQETTDDSRRPWRSYVTRARPAGDFARFSCRTEGELAVGKKHTIFVDKVETSYQEGPMLLRRAEQHIKHNVTRIEGKFYRQVVGMGQGSVISSIASNFLYGDMEQRYLNFLSERDSLLLRLVDDFLLITLDRQQAERFFATVVQGIPEYGITINTLKSMVNFDVSIDGIAPPPLCVERRFPYCGTLIDTRTLDISKDRAGRKLNDQSDSAVVEYTKLPGHTFYRKMLK